MAKYVPDIKTQRWVVISPTRTSRPADTVHREVPQSGTKWCPFCPGNESLTPPEVYRIGAGEKDGPGWQVRVVPNKYPITDIHEVFIHSASHTDNIHILSVEQVVRIFTCYRDRYRAHDSDGQVLIFCNHGYHAGASLAHPHSQLVVVPKQINLDALSREPIINIVEDDTYFVTYCPDFSQWPYETWIAPKEEGTKFGDIEDKVIASFAGVLKRTLERIEKIWDTSAIRPKDRLNDPFDYNYYIYHGTNWYIRIIPRFVHRAGFELGTGLNVNVVDPSEACHELIQVSISI
jgi:UDPglucose--hexose-1-phosphate uridylyltransferase